MDQWHLRQHLEEHHEASFGWALQCCSGRMAEAEDVLQEVYLKVLEGRAKFSGRASFRTWLFAVIRMTAASERRRHWLRHLGLLRKSREPSSSAMAESPADSVLRNATAATYRQMLSTLPRRQQEVLHLTFYQDMTIQQAADVMQVSVGSARQHYERGKERLRRLLTALEEQGAR